MSNVNGMNRWQIEVFLHQQYGQTIGWIANVINCQCSNPTKKVRGLARLAAEDRVTSGGTIGQVNIDGSIVDIVELEKFAPKGRRGGAA